MPKLSINCLFLGDDSSNVFTVKIPRTENISILKDLIKDKQSPRLDHVVASALILSQVSLPVDDDLEERLKSVDLTPLKKPLSPLYQVFPRIEQNHLHIVVQAPTESIHLTPKKSSYEYLPRVSRSNTVSALYQKLTRHQFIQVRGTPGTGKTSLCHLLAHYIREHEPMTSVISIFGWSPKEGDNRSDRWKRHLEGQGWVETDTTVFIFDEAQASYNDGNLWNNFFKSIDHYRNSRAIVFTSYGSPTTRIITMEGTPMMIADQQRVTLRAIQHDDNLPPAGLFFNRIEFNDLVSELYSSPEFVFDISFFDALFKITEGHVGAITDFIRVILAHDSYRIIRNTPNELYTWTTFLQRVSLSTLVEKLASSSIFARGLPPTSELQHPNIVAVFEAVLCTGIVTDSDFSDHDAKAALSQCFHQGWLHTDKIDKTGVAGYYFPSPLHRWYVETKLWGTTPSAPVNLANLLEFSVAVIRLFSPQTLATSRRIGAGFIQHPPEAQYQDEFYRCSRQYSKGSLLTFPEYGTQSGRVDFYIPSKKWAIELLRDGDRLEQHSSRFLPSGAYGATMTMSDHIILDFRNNFPKIPHPYIPNLYHVVFSSNFRTVTILHNNLECVPNGEFALLSSP